MMTEDDLLRSLAQLRRDSRQLRGKLSRAVRYGQSTRDGRDGTGTVTVLLDDDGAACDVRVAADWQARLRLGELGGAVCSADADAAQRRALATGEELARLDQVEPDQSTVDDGEITAGPHYASAPGARRTLSQLTEATWAALDDLARFSTPPSPVWGLGAGGAVRLQVAQGRIVDCVLDSRWLGQQDATTLANGLREALCSARAAAEQAQRPSTQFQQRLADLLADVQATMTAHAVARPR